MNYENYLDFSLGDIIFSLVVTIIAYMIVPMIIKIIKKEPFDKRKSFIISLVNSIVVGVIFYIIKVETIENYTGGFSVGPMLLYYFINNWLLQKEFKRKDKTYKINKIKSRFNVSLNKVFIIINVSLLILLLISIIYNISLSSENKNIKNKFEENLKILESEYESNLNLEKEKIDFYDDNIVFVVDGYEEFAYQYDCLEKYIDEDEYSFWAYNRELALDKGYKIIDCK